MPIGHASKPNASDAGLVRAVAWSGLGVASVVLGLLGALAWQANRKAKTTPEYVALGSSFAAGLGLGRRAPGSPLVCQRSVNGYPQQLARLRGLSLVDMTCSGATTRDVLQGGRLFLPPQLDGLGTETALVTLTIGGNDVGYIGDLFLRSLSGKRSALGWLARRFAKDLRPVEARDWAKLQADLAAILAEIRRRSPDARIIVVTYPTVLPPQGGCARLGVDAQVADVARRVGERLAATTRAAADEAGAVLVDMHVLGAAHHACSEQPWVNGAVDTQGAPFHPTLAGAKATAEAISGALD